MDIEAMIAALDRGEVRVAEKVDGNWRVNEEAKAAILEYFRVRKVEPLEVGPFEYLDKIPLKHDHAERGVRVVPPATARYGSFLSPGVILMPSYVNIGAWVGPNTMVDTWATVGSCAQIGADVHLAGGVGVGGVLEPVQARPVIVEDGAFVGSRCILTEGVLVGERELGLMKDTAILVNTARGPLVDTAALEKALQNGWIAGAALDVTDPEPLPGDHPLLRAPNLTVVPHVGSATHDTRAAMTRLAVDNLRAGLAGERMPACANPEVYDGPTRPGP